MADTSTATFKRVSRPPVACGPTLTFLRSVAEDNDGTSDGEITPDIREYSGRPQQAR